jgi:predicted ATPase
MRATMDRLRLKLLGGFEVRPSAGPAPTLPIKAQALLAYLAVRPGQSHPRDKLATLLWGDTGDAQARDSLRHTVAALRKAVEPAAGRAFVTEGQSLALDPELIEVDVVTFEGRVAEATPDALEAAVTLYRGDLLEGLAVSEARFEEWLLAERERLLELALEALAKLLAYQSQTGATERAIQTAVRLLSLDPLQEVVHRALMQLYARQGRRGAALKQYQICVSVLQRELGAEPEAETKQIYLEVLQRRSVDAAAGGSPSVTMHDRPATGVSAARPPVPVAAIDLPLEPKLVGRDAEFGELRQALDDAGNGHGRVVMITGEAGIGKTAVITAIAAEASRRGARVLLGRSHESEHILSFGPWVEILRAAVTSETLDTLEPPWRAELARLLPEIQRPDLPAASDDTRRLFESVVHVLFKLAAVEPLVVLLEDVHWADDLSLRLLAFVSRRVPGTAVLLLATMRDDEPAASPERLDHVREELRREPSFTTLELKALGQSDTLALVRALARTGTDDEITAKLADTIWIASEGNPFVVGECVRVVEQGGAAESSRLVLPSSVRELVARRLDRLSDRTALLVSVAAVIGREFEFDLLRRAAGLDSRNAGEGLEELVRRRLLQGVGEHFEFIHDRIRRVAYERLLSPKRRTLHAAVGHALEELAASDLAPHYHALAVHYREGEVWDRAARFLYATGERSFAYSAYGEAREWFDDALTALERAGPLADRSLELDVLLELWAAGYESGSHDGKVLATLSERAEVLAMSLGKDARLAQLRIRQAQASWTVWHRPGAADAAIEYARDALRLAHPDDVRTRSYAWFVSGAARRNLGRLEEALGDFANGVRLFVPAHEIRDGRALLLSPILTSLYAWRAEAQAVLGRFEEALASGREALRVAEDIGHDASRAMASALLGYVLVLKGDLESAVPVLESGLAIAERIELMHGIRRNAYPLAWILFLLDRSDEGRRCLARASAAPVGGTGRLESTRYGLLIAAAHLEAGQLVEADTALAQGLSNVEIRGERGHVPPLWRLRAELLFRRATDPDEELRLRRESVRLATDLGLKPEVAHGHLRLSRFYRRAGDEARANASLAIALDLLRGMAMGWWQREAEAAPA